MIEPSLTVGLLTQFSRTFCKGDRSYAPQTIDDVLTELDQIILRAQRAQPSWLFSTLYRNVTI